MIRGLLRELGHILAKGAGAAIRFAKSCLAGDLPDIPDLAKGLISTLCDQLTELCGRISMYSKLIERIPVSTSAPGGCVRSPALAR